MDRELIVRLNKSFEDSAYEENGVEYWLARKLQALLEYDEWRNFSKVIEKAKTSCHTAGQNSAHHFVDVNKMVDLGLGSQRQVDDCMLTRYACYLIAQNGDPRKQTIAFAQSYFAIQTRRRAGQKEIKNLESQRNEKRRSFFDAQDQVDKQRGELIAQIEGKLAQKRRISTLFRIRWRLA